MLSQLTKTIKMALKSTEEERAILRARSAVQRFPVVEWRQRIEDLHKRSIMASRHGSGQNAWRPDDGGGLGMRIMADTDDWNPALHPSPYPDHQPGWDERSIASYANTPVMSSQESLANPEMPAPPRMGDEDVSSHSSDQGYADFMGRVNKAIAKDSLRNVPDPFVDPSGLRPFGNHSRISSAESISSIMDEKSNSPLNKAIASVSFFFKTTTERRELRFFFFSLQMRMVKLLPSLFKNCKTWMPRTLNGNYRLRSIWSRVKKRFLEKFDGTSFRVRRA